MDDGAKCAWKPRYPEASSEPYPDPPCSRSSVKDSLCVCHIPKVDVGEPFELAPDPSAELTRFNHGVLIELKRVLARASRSGDTRPVDIRGFQLPTMPEEFEWQRHPML